MAMETPNLSNQTSQPPHLGSIATSDAGGELGALLGPLFLLGGHPMHGPRCRRLELFGGSWFGHLPKS